LPEPKHKSKVHLNIKQQQVNFTYTNFRQHLTPTVITNEALVSLHIQSSKSALFQKFVKWLTIALVTKRSKLFALSNQNLNQISLGCLHM